MRHNADEAAMKLRAHRFLVSLFAVAVGLAFGTKALAQTDPLA
jgi:hypothetical protein